jgi:hypothetical protein
MSGSATNHRLKTSTLRNHRSVAALDTSNPNYKSSPLRSRQLDVSPKSVGPSNTGTGKKAAYSVKRTSSQVTVKSKSPRFHIVSLIELNRNEFFNHSSVYKRLTEKFIFQFCLKCFISN